MLNKLSMRTILATITILAVVSVVFLLTRPATATATVIATSTPFSIAQATAIPTATAVAAPAKSVPQALISKATASLISANQASLAFLAGGRVKEIRVKEGDRVKAGTVLAAIDTSLMELQALQAQAALDMAKANFDRAKAGPTADEIALAKSNFDRAKAGLDQAQFVYDRAGGESNPYIGMLPQSLALQQAYSGYQAAVAQYNLTIKHPTDTELKLVTAQLAQAQAAVDLAKQNLLNGILVAPFDGTVVLINSKIGETASPGMPAIVLADLSRMQAQAGLDENTLRSVRVGQKVTLALDALGDKTLTGRVQKIGMMGTNLGGVVSVLVTIDIDPTDAPIYPGLSATVEFQP